MAIFLLSLSITVSAQSYTRVGDIAYDAAIDNKDFFLCYDIETNQYYSLSAHYVLDDQFIYNHFSNPILANSGISGYITLRFLINCEGKIGRFRVLQAGPNLEAITFPKEVTDSFLTNLAKITNWPPFSYEGKYYDAYMYLTFKMENGKIEEILP
jgi:hypothetical protein